MPPKRRAPPTETEKLTGPRNTKQRRLESPNPVLFEGRDVLISLGPRSFKLRKEDLRANSAYFAEFPEDQFPKRFALVSGGDVDDIAGWRLLPKGISEEDEFAIEEYETFVENDETAAEDQLENDPTVRAREVHKVVLGLMCSPLQYTHLLRSERSAFIISVAKRIAAYGCTFKVNDAFIGKIFTANLDRNLYRDQPCLLIQVAYHLKHEGLFTSVVPHVSGRYNRFSKEMESAPTELRSCVWKENDKFTDDAYDVRQKILKRLTGFVEPLEIWGIQIFCRHINLSSNDDSDLFLADPEHPGFYDCIKSVYDLKHVRADAILPCLRGFQKIEHALRIGLRAADRDGFDVGEIRSAAEAISLAEAEAAVLLIIKEVKDICKPFWKANRGLGYFTPSFKGLLPWQTVPSTSSSS